MPPLLPSTTESQDDSTLLAFLAAAASLSALAHYSRWGQLLLSGDAVAHINIARRVFDSRTPGPGQLGTVWLPLQHILTIPFVVSDWAWSSGVGGAIPSMFGYVLGTVGVYRLVRAAFAAQDALAVKIAAWLAAVIYAANPNLLYVQTTALNEPLSMGLFVWTVLMFVEFRQSLATGDDDRAAARLRRCGWLLLAGMLVRYDAWFAGVVIVVAALTAVLMIARRRAGRAITPGLRKGLLTFVLLIAAAPALWLGYNAVLWGNPLEFATGRYSAKAILERSRRPGEPQHPGWHAPYVAAQYFLKDLKLNLGEGSTARWEKPWLPVAALASLAVLVAARDAWPLLLLWIPLPFYAISIAWGGVPVFIPPWWPFSHYNTRYALQLLPAVAVFWAAAAYFAVSRMPISLYFGTRGAMAIWRTRWLRFVIPVLLLVLTGLSYASVWRTVPLCLREVRINGSARYALDGLLAFHLRHLPANATVLMYTGEHSGALQRAEVPLRRTINEGQKKAWPKALQDPATAADFIIATAGDPVAQAVAAHPDNLVLLGVLQTPGQNPIHIYASQYRRKQ